MAPSVVGATADPGTVVHRQRNTDGSRLVGPSLLRNTIIRLALASSAVCLASWLALAATAGGVGLQWSISRGAMSLLENPGVIAGVTVTTLAVAYLSAARFRVATIPLVIGVLIGDLFAGLVLAPIAVGELAPIHAPLVFAAVAVVGLQPAVVLIGAWAARARQTGS
jgi:hypothetical protein